MLNYQQIGTAYSEQLANSPVGYLSTLLVDMWVASIIESYYGPTKWMMGASNLDFVCWPNAKVVDTLYKDMSFTPKSLCG